MFNNYVTSLIDDETIFVKMYVMRQDIQNKLLRILFNSFSDDLFRLRGELIDLFNNRDLGVIQKTLSSLNRFKRKPIFVESFIKAFGFKKITVLDACARVVL